MNYFAGCMDIKQARKEYIKLAQKHHPDKGGDTKVMQEINDQFDNFKKGKSRMGFSSYRYRGSDHTADSFSYTWRWDDVFEKVKKAHFYDADEWNEDIEREANKKEKERKEKLAEEMRQAKEREAARKKELERLLEDQIHRIWFEINREISKNFANGLINKMPDHSLNDFIRESMIKRIILG